MFLVHDRVDAQADQPLWFDLEQAQWHHPSPLSVPRWRIEAGSSWLVTGPGPVLGTVPVMLSEAAAPETGGLAGQRPRLHRVANDQALLDAAHPPRQPWWKFWATPPVADEPVQVARWLADLPGGPPLERLVLAEIARGLDAGADLLLLDRILTLIRPQVRFRLASHLIESVNRTGLTLITLSEEQREGWVAAEQHAVISRGVLRPVYP